MESFWCKIMFKDFVKHFRKLDEKAIIKDIKESMDALEDLCSEGESFGAKMVAWSNERIEENRQQRIEAGKKSGIARAKNLKKNSANQEFSVSQNERSAANAAGRNRRRFRAPSTEDLYTFCNEKGIDEADARDCYEMCCERKWKDQSGNQICDWKKFVLGFCESRQQKRIA